MGFNAGIAHTTGDNNIYVGHVGVASESNTIRIGTVSAVTDDVGAVHAVHRSTYIAGVSGVAVMGSPVVVSPAGQLGVRMSSEQFKDAIQPMDKASEAILALKPVTFRYKKEIDPDRIPQFGLVAEEVEKVNPDLVARDRLGTPYTVRYEAVNAMLLNEFLKALVARVKEQELQIQKVSAELEVRGPAPQMARSN